MALFLYRLGRACAHHPWRVIAGWIALVLALGGAAAAFGTPPTSRVSIPDSQFQRVFDTLGREIPTISGSGGTIVLESTTGRFTPQQVAAAREAFAGWKRIEHVSAVNDPFTSQQQLDAAAGQVAKGQKGIDAGRAQLRQARDRLDAGQAQLSGGEALVAQLARTQPGSPQLAQLRAQVAAGKAELKRGEAEYAKGKAQLESGATELAQGRAQTEMLGGLRFVTADGRYAVSQIQFDTEVQSLSAEIKRQIPDSAREVLERAGVRAEYSVEITQEISVVGAGEIIGLIVAVTVLVLMLGTLIAAGLPVAVALLGVGVGVTAALALTAFYEMNDLTPSLALMLGLAVGIDYSLFIVNRHRTLLLGGGDLHESIGRATGTAGSAVVFAGATVVIALTALVISGLPILAQMGFVAAGTVAAAVAVAVTLSPAVLALMGTRVIPRRTWRAAGFTTPGDTSTRQVPDDDHEEEHGGWYVRLVTARPVLTILAVVGIVAVMAVPALDLRLGLPDGGSEARDTTAYRTYSLVDEQFGPGMNGPLLAVASLPAGSSAAEAAAATARIGTDLSRIEGIAHVSPIGTSADHDTVAFQVVPDSGPADARTIETVHNLKASADALEQTSGARLGFTGQTVANIEISEKLAAALPLYLAVVVGLSMLILLVVFRSVVVPVLATAGFLLSIAAAFGATVAVYQWGWFGDLLGVSRPGAIMSFMPILVIGVLFGLAMDYQMFLVSGMHEAYAHGEDARRAVVTGFVHGAKVVTVAAIIMFSVFFGFVFSHLVMVRPIGLGLGVGVLVDAVLVRMTLTPALMHALGERAWWIPAWLERILPNLDVEGTTLTAHLTDTRDRSDTTPAPAAP